jgi:hypothetical protein
MHDRLINTRNELQSDFCSFCRRKLFIVCLNTTICFEKRVAFGEGIDAVVHSKIAFTLTDFTFSVNIKDKPSVCP